MRERTIGYCVAGLTLALLLLSCGPRYLSEPPPEFDDYIESIPVPSGAVQLSEYTYRWTSPQEICTGFGNDRLYGTQQAFPDMVASIEEDFELAGTHYVKVADSADHITYVLSDVATVDAYYVSADNPVSAIIHGTEILTERQAHYETLFSISAEHSYGDCAPHPWWTK